MPTILKNETVTGFAHCVARKGQCPGYAQEPVQAIVEEIGETAFEKGGEGHAIENSHTYLRFADEDDAACPHPGCGARRELTLQERKVYEEFIPGEVLAAVPAEDSTGELAELRAAVAVLLAEKAERDAA